MYDPAVRCKSSCRWRRAVLHQCVRPLIGARSAPGHHACQSVCNLISGQASLGHSGHQCWHAPGRRNLHLFSFSSPTWAVYLVDAPNLKEFLCSCRWPIPFRPGLHVVNSRCAQGRSRLAGTLTSCLALPLPGRALTVRNCRRSVPSKPLHARPGGTKACASCRGSRTHLGFGARPNSRLGLSRGATATARHAA